MEPMEPSLFLVHAHTNPTSSDQSKVPSKLASSGDDVRGSRDSGSKKVECRLGRLTLCDRGVLTSPDSEGFALRSAFREDRVTVGGLQCGKWGGVLVGWVCERKALNVSFDVRHGTIRRSVHTPQLRGGTSDIKRSL